MEGVQLDWVAVSSASAFLSSYYSLANSDPHILGEPTLNGVV